MVEKDKRVLGDEWQGWDGISGKEKLNESVLLFVGIAISGLVLFAILLLVQLYLIKPRLDQFTPAIHDALLVLVFLIPSIFIVLLSLLAFSIHFKGSVSSTIASPIFRLIRLMLPLALKISKLLGITIDRLGSSFVQVHNMLTESMCDSVKSKSLAILAPRCMHKDLLVKIKELRNIYDFELYVVGGGSAAFKILKEKRPSSVIGIACERDLLSGIRDLDVGIPVIGIPNERPEGPCKNTIINMDKLESAINMLAGKKA